MEKNKDREIHLVITDLVMPVLGGKKFADEIRRKFPKTPILFISGYSDEDISLEEGIHFLPKPFTRDSLARKVREVLDKAR